MSSNNNGGSELSCLAMVCLGLVFMPAVGVYLIISEGSNDRKLLGLILTVVGGIIWIAAGSH